MKKMVLKFLALATIVAVLQVPVGIFMDDQPFHDRDRLDRFLQDRVDVLYLGDSVLASGFHEDEDRRDIARMVEDELGGAKVGLVQNAGYDLALYEAFIEFTVRQPQRPRAIVVPINFRFLSPSWEESFPLERSRLIWGDLLGLGFYRPRSRYRWTAGEPPPQASPSGTPADAWNVYYGYELRSDHPKLRALQRLILRCREAGIVPVIYITPINVDRGVHLAGPEFPARISRNAVACRTAAAAAGEQLLDLSALVPEAKDFEAVEHLRERGRKAVAMELARAIRMKLRP